MNAPVRPPISVVIASVNGPEHLDGCLAALDQQTIVEEVEVVVADRCGEAVMQVVRQRYPRVRWLSCAADSAIPELRARGVEAAQGEIIAITEDHCIAPPDWCRQILAAHHRRNGIIGGAVENHTEMNRLLDWATYLCEYAPFMSPVPDGETRHLPGNNISYRRAMLAEVKDLVAQGRFWEDEWNARLAKKGYRTFSDPSIVVQHRKRFSIGEFLSQRYHYSRSYAGIRVAEARPGKRLVYAVLCVALPALVLGRIGYHVLTKKRQAGKFFVTLPILAIFSIVWAWGEFVGYLFGPGASLRRVE